ncbi:Uncharacterised protein [Vibrio cholerae]|nr:Uncharacterised protein [Vibrio cholerae]
MPSSSYSGLAMLISLTPSTGAVTVLPTGLPLA